ncbi:OB-fold nucleic acid binding domain-containing protein [Streptomyces sp. 6N223]|uniref:OB-fold nucleic acid binding domain-containing protein n=1 Tax=Streptomyces sp. 6N223 TaxID=3457412 RepID=UPI003FD37546
MRAGGRSGGPSGRRGVRRWRLLGRGGPSTAPTDRTAPPGPLPGPGPGSVSATAPRPAAPGCTPIRDCVGEPGPRGRPVVRVVGTLRAVGERSVAGMPALTAELDDGTASLAVVWLGRRAIAGIEPGRALVASGRISMTRGRPVLFNPRYELQPGEEE